MAVVVELEPAGDNESEDDHIDPVVVGAGATVTVLWHSTGAYVLAYLDDPSSLGQSSFFSLASPVPWDEDLPAISVPQSC
jgi:hypothetical protein